MNTTYIFFSLLVGWCGTVPPFPIPGPDPDPWWQRAGISVLGGLVGGFLVTQFLSSEVSLVTVSIGAFVGGRVFSNLYNIVRNIALPQDPVPSRKDNK